MTIGRTPPPIRPQAWASGNDIDPQRVEDLGSRRQGGTLNYADYLTDHDKQVVHAGTGIRIKNDARGGLPLLAVQIGMDRKNGRLAHGQLVSVTYLKNLIAGFVDSGRGDPFRGAVQKAIAFLGDAQPANRLDFSL